MLKEAIAMLTKNKGTWLEFQSGQMQFAGLGALEQRALKDIFCKSEEEDLLRSKALCVWD
ncbi:competence pheromone ComX [Saccharibacillus kuerlensis]|uniref:ComX pheromone n=1 Tax=Saccharibacillus kuerlensis TaxID=459527 RepID=A0ABQ2L244_9BACL|nr:competence pheromone ComX [Saccharibacillus kuerlensis]GGN99967.1 hypothetical protein GCM10010969_20660 [Saccharibacillus kuerlensis]